MSAIAERKLSNLVSYLTKHGLQTEGWEVHVSANTGKILRYTHARHGTFRNRLDILRALRQQGAGPSRPMVYDISSDEDAEDVCPVCLSNFGDDVFKVAKCGHRFCAACIARHLEVNANDVAMIHPTKNLPRCPACVAAKAQAGYSTDGVLLPDEIDVLHRRGHLPDDAHRRMHKAMALACVPEGDLSVTCPKCETQFLVKPGTGADKFKVNCPNRNCDCRDLCAKCMVAHPGHCPDVVDEATRSLHVGAVPCPGSCGFMLQKRDTACNCLTCGKCKIKVCGLCGARIATGIIALTAYEHFRVRGTPCYGKLWVDPVAWAEAKAAKDKAAEDKAAKDKAAEDKAAKDKAAEDKAAKDKAAKDRAARKRAATERAAEERAAAEQATKKSRTDEPDANKKPFRWLLWR